MRKMLFFLTLTAVISTLFVWLSNHNSDISITWLGYQIDTNVMFVAICFVAMIAGISVFFMMLLRRKTRKLRKKNDMFVGQLTQSYIALEQGDVKELKRLSSKISKQLAHHKKEHPLVHILRAKAAQLSQDNDALLSHYTQLLDYPETEMGALKQLVEHHIALGHYRKATKMAQEAAAKHPRNEILMRLLPGLYKQQQDWENFDKSLEKIKKKHRGTEESSHFDWHHEKALSCLMLSRDMMEKDKPQLAWKLLEEAQKTDPNFVPAMLQALTSYAELGKGKRLVQLIEKQWAVLPHPALGEWYVEYTTSSDIQKTRRALKLAKQNPSHVETYLLLAKNFMLTEEYGTVQSYLQDAEVALGGHDAATSRLCVMWLEYLEKTQKQATDEYAIWQERASHARKDSEFRCESCGESYDDWHLECRECQSKDRISWHETGHKHGVELLAATS